MDMLSPTPSPQRQTQSKHWPDARAERGIVYGVPDPIYAGDKLVVMLNDTWLDYGTQAQRMKRDLDAAIEAGKKLKVSYDIAIKELAELREKHENLKAAEKRRRRAAMGFKGSGT